MTKRRSAAFLALAVLALAAGCGQKPAPDKWTLWYVPNEPKAATTFSKQCQTIVFADAPDAKTFRVAIVQRITGVPNDRAFLHSGDDFSGPMELGTTTLHDDSSGYNVSVNSVYRVNAYVAAKARADADCPPEVPSRVPRPSTTSRP